MNLFRSVALLGLLAASYAPVFAQEGVGRTSVRQFGALCNGVHDDTEAFARAVAVNAGGLLTVPAGRCVLSDTIVISKPIKIEGVGLGSQIYGRNDKTLFLLKEVKGVVMRDLYLGSASSAAGVSIIELDRSHHNEISGVTMLGGYYGVHLAGALLNTFNGLRSGVNIRGFFAPVSEGNHYWVFAERRDPYAANANTFIAPALEGGKNGVYVRDQPRASCTGCLRGGEGSVTIVGGTIEGVRGGTALTLDRTFLASNITGVHFEANTQDVAIIDSANVRLTSITSLGGPGGSGDGGIRVTGLNGGQFVRNIQISDSVVQQFFAEPNVRRLQLQNIVTDLQCTSPDNGALAPFIAPPAPFDPSVVYANIGHNCT